MKMRTPAAAQQTLKRVGFKTCGKIASLNRHHVAYNTCSLRMGQERDCQDRDQAALFTRVSTAPRTPASRGKVNKESVRDEKWPPQERVDKAGHG